MNIRGIIPPVATPMQPTEDLDLPRLKSRFSIGEDIWQPTFVAGEFLQARGQPAGDGGSLTGGRVDGYGSAMQID